MSTQKISDERYIAKARELWHGSHDGEIEIDDKDVKTSWGELAGGCWVSAWVWVSDEEPGL